MKESEFWLRHAKRLASGQITYLTSLPYPRQRERERWVMRMWAHLAITKVRPLWNRDSRVLAALMLSHEAKSEGR